MGQGGWAEQIVGSMGCYEADRERSKCRWLPLLCLRRRPFELDHGSCNSALMSKRGIAFSVEQPDYRCDVCPLVRRATGTAVAD